MVIANRTAREGGQKIRRPRNVRILPPSRASRHCEEPTGRANPLTMTGSATKQSIFPRQSSWIASLALAMTILNSQLAFPVRLSGNQLINQLHGSISAFVRILLQKSAAVD
jgi:hypothetical protein